ncbi:MAG: hypothetical protein JO219_11020 [Candidatus Eremiobacteraeota bacterium]|nr:hypothetical protein [Candidatus Eremiobacteraeota bacterium]MBV8366852.1 hypothetical protein [Candidatus Eremiobacteraeota bacterium]
MILAVLSTWALLHAVAPHEIAAATPTPSPAASAPAVVRTPPPNAHVWQGITPGSSTQTVRAKFGEPLLVRVLPDGSLLDWYPGPTDNAYVIIGERDKIVQYVRAFPLAPDGSLDGLTDPYGVKPGLDYAQIKSLRGEAQQAHQVAPGTAVILYPEDQGFVWLYELTADGVHAISLYDDKAPRGNLNSPQVADAHDGTSIGRAYVLHAKNEQEGTRFERYYATHRAGCATWQVANQTVLSLGARKIDQLDLQCAETKDETSMFFDVTSFIGKS